MTEAEEIRDKITGAGSWKPGAGGEGIEEMVFAAAEDMMEYLVSIHYDENAVCELKA